jgi:hypothetical protein
MHLPPVSQNCTVLQLASHAPDLDPDPFDIPDLEDLAATRFPGATAKPWLADVKLTSGRGTRDGSAAVGAQADDGRRAASQGGE